MKRKSIASYCLAPIAALMVATASADEPGAAKLPTLEEATKGFTKVMPSDGGTQSLYTLYVKPESRNILAALPRDYDKQTLLFGQCVSAGMPTSGIQGDTLIVRWKRQGDRLVMLKPQYRYRNTGGPESARAHAQLFSEQSILDVPIVAEGEGGAPVIALDNLMVDQSTLFFQWSPGGLESKLAIMAKAKAFADNLTVSFEMPWRMSMTEQPHNHGQLVTLAYSLSVLPDPADYTPRQADQRVGYFISSFYDLGKVGAASTPRTRYIKRWKLEKADPTLAISPPREPIVFYIDHKTPIRYRRWVREGVLEWNKAFEKVGIVNAIEVHQQDATTGAHMEKDPESIRYNFIIWNTNDISFAIGPCRIDPRTGRILDADVVMNDGWLRVAADGYRKHLAGVMMEGLDRETLDWLEERPEWDPRVRCADPRAREAAKMMANAPRSTVDPARLLEHGAACGHADCRAMDLNIARLSLVDLDLAALGSKSGGSDTVADVPEEFIGQQIKDVVMHEVGHVLGLRHNFKASSVYTLEQINSKEWVEQGRPITGSVMDYSPINYANTANTAGAGGGVQGPYFMTTLGAYDIWAIRYGYAPDSEIEAILKEAGKPEHIFGTDEDLYGPDPSVRMRDLGADVLNSVDSDMVLVQRLRSKILERALKNGESYERAREAYFTLMGIHARSVTTLARYVGGVTQHRDRVGESERNPTEPIPAAEQRRALDQLIRYAFKDDAFGLTPELLAKMSFDRWFDQDSIPQDLPDPQLDVHDVVLNFQAAALTLLLNPSKLRRIADTEFRIPADQDALTVVEMLGTVQNAIWSELDVQAESGSAYTARRPYVSSLRRNLQREHLERMITLSTSSSSPGAVSKSVAALSANLLRQLDARIEKSMTSGAELDPYSVAHLEDARSRIRRALEGVYLYK